ncbi:ras di-ras and rheb family members of small gtpase superfamily [Anaeramoeba ignava]|uniref:Ras di-ras and rheb family members of small gtpase superfamily n=1 Tax=Anaeramoeba ignava TaxID=1746090 RepID=A0A9Q0LN34_ANAIG|nr:ras di-ras and rheb family members of small gtpase superfamily [Anaeramoeba ignava]
MNQVKPINIGITGTENSGRKSLNVQYVMNYFGADDYIRDFLNDNMQRNVLIDGKPVLIELFFIEEHEYRQGWENLYRMMDIFVIMVSITRREDLKEIPELMRKAKFYKILNKLSDSSVILVGNKIDLEFERQIATQELEEIARENGILFIEISTKTRTNVDECFEITKIRRKRQKKKRSGKIFKSKEIPPFPKLPEPFPRPKLEVLPSTYQDDFKSLLKNERFSDVELCFAEKKNEPQSLYLHRFVLCSRNGVFKQLIEKYENQSEDLEEFSEKIFLKMEKKELNQENENKKENIGNLEKRIKIYVDYAYFPFYLMIKFIYCGIIEDEMMKDVEIARQIQTISDLFEVKNLSLVTKELLEKEDQDEKKAERMKISDWKREKIESSELDQIRNCYSNLLKSHLYSDFTILLMEGNTKQAVKTHLGLLSQRCDYFKSMIQLKMKEVIENQVVLTNIGMESLLFILEYIYCDRFVAPSVELAVKEGNKKFIWESNSKMLELLIASDYLQVLRLNQLCQVNLSRTLDHELIPQALQVSKSYGAKFLMDYCYWEMGRNYPKFEKMKNFKKLKKEDQKKVKELRFPPKEYDDYKKKYDKKK